MQNNWKSALESTIRKTIVFFHRQQWKEIFIFISFVLLAFSFWLLQSLQDDSERRFEVSLRYKNVPDEWTLSENNPKTVSVVLKDKGISFLYYVWNKRLSSMDISVADLQKTPDSLLLVTNKMLESVLAKQLIISTSIIFFEPNDIKLRYDMLSSRLSQVSANISITTKPGFQLSDSITISPSQVNLFGSSKALESLDQIKTKPIALDGVEKTRELTVQLDLPTGVKADIETVKLTVPVEEYTEKTMHLPVHCFDIPDGYVLRMFPSVVEISCTLPLSVFRELTEEMLEIMIPFSEFEENQATGKIPVRLTRKPAWVNTIIVPGEVEFIIEHHD